MKEPDADATNPRNHETETRVVVVGAGLSGLVTADALAQTGADVIVLEADNRAGGRIRTHREDGYLVEEGPNAVSPFAPGIQDLLKRHGGRLLKTPKMTPRFVVQNGRPHPLPKSPGEFLATRLMGPMTKLRILMEPFVPAPACATDESVDAFVQRRFGSGVLHLADAALTGIHAGDPGRLSARHACGPLVDLERKGGILRNLPRLARGTGRLATPADGMEAWIDRMARKLPVQTGTRVDALETGRHATVVHTNDGRFVADKVVLACDLPRAAALLGGAAAIPVAPVTVVAFGLPTENGRLQGFGVLAPERERRFILGATFDGTLFPGRAPAGHNLLRVFVGGRRHPERALMPDDALADKAWRDLQGLGLVKGEPAYRRVVRTRGIPQLETGHEDRLKAIPHHPRVRLVGMGATSIGVAGLVRAAQEAAFDLLGTQRAVEWGSAETTLRARR